MVGARWGGRVFVAGWWPGVTSCRLSSMAWQVSLSQDGEFDFHLSILICEVGIQSIFREKGIKLCSTYLWNVPEESKAE